MYGERTISQTFTYVNEEHSEYVYTAEVEVTCTIVEDTWDTPGTTDNEVEVLSIERIEESGQVTVLVPSDPDYPELYSWAYDKGMVEDNFDDL